MALTTAYEKPLSVEVYDGEVVIRSTEGPFGVSLTASAAASTAKALASAAEAAMATQSSHTDTSRD